MIGWYKHAGAYCLKNGKLYGVRDANVISFLGKYDSYNWVLSGHGERIPIKSSSEVESAYSLEIWGSVDGYPMQICNIIEGKCSMEPTTEEMAKHFGVGFVPDKYESRYDAVLKSEDEIDSIWEVRTPIEGFPFNTEKIVYLKMYGKWLGE